MAFANAASAPSAVKSTDGDSTGIKPLFSNDAVEFVPTCSLVDAAEQSKGPASNWSASDFAWTAWRQHSSVTCAVNLDEYTDDSDSEADEEVTKTCKTPPAVLEPAFEESVEPAAEPTPAEDAPMARRPWRLSGALPATSGDDSSWPVRRAAPWRSAAPWKRECGAGELEPLETKEAELSPVSQSGAGGSDSSEPEDEEPVASPREEVVSHADSLPALEWRTLNPQELLRWRAAVTEAANAAAACTRLATREARALAVKRADEDVSRLDKSWRAMTVSPTKVEKIEVSDNSWAARQRARRNSGVPSEPDAEVVRSVKSILNKLTVDKFPQLFRQLVDCGFSTHNHVQILIKEIFEKATTQHHFIDMYADICVLLQEHFATNSIGQDDPSFSFKRLLLNACQASFDQNQKAPAELHLLPDDQRTVAEVRYKTKMLGTVRLLGALLARRMIASRVLVSVLAELLGDPTSEALESAAALLTAAGAMFDDSEWVHYSALEAVFAQIEDIVNRRTCTPRVRCLLKDVLELRSRGWEDSRPKRIESPTTLMEQARLAQDSDRGCW